MRVLVEDEQGAPLPGVAVELRRAGEEPRVYATGNDGNADAWVPNGHWMIRARLTNFHRAEGTLDVASDRFCRMTFRLPLDPPDRVAY